MNISTKGRKSKSWREAPRMQGRNTPRGEDSYGDANGSVKAEGTHMGGGTLRAGLTATAKSRVKSGSTPPKADRKS